MVLLNSCKVVSFSLITKDFSIRYLYYTLYFMLCHLNTFIFTLFHIFNYIFTFTHIKVYNESVQNNIHMNKYILSNPYLKEMLP